MRAHIRWFFLTILALAPATAAMAQQGVHWQQDLEAARRQAAQSGRLILVHFYTDVCDPCKAMDREVFSRPDVAAALEVYYVPVKINAQYAPQIVRELNVTRWPTDVVLSPQGAVLDRNIGYLGPAQYVNRMNQIATTAKSRMPAMTAQIPGGPAPAANPPAATTPNFAAVNPTGLPSAPTARYADNLATNNPNTPNNQNITGGYPQPGIPAGTEAIGAGANRPNPRGGVEGYATPPWNTTAASPTDHYLPGSTQLPGNPPVGAPTMPAVGNPVAAGPSQGVGAVAMLPSNRVGNLPDHGPATGGSEQPPLALDGYCVVQLAEKVRWVKGNPRFGVIHRGRLYLFAGPDEARRFYLDPERYSPVLSGNDLVTAIDQGKMVVGRREHGAWYEGRLYLFSTEESYHRFDQDPQRYITALGQLTAASTARRQPTLPVGTGGLGADPAPNARY